MFSFLWHCCSAAWAGFRQFVYLSFYLPSHVSKHEKPDDIEATPSAGLTSATYNMEEAPQVLALSNTEAAQWNRDILLKFKAALEKNPAVDLLSMFSDSYRCEHRNAQYSQLSYAARINLRTLSELEDTLKREPEVNLLSAFPANYTRRITMATGPPVLLPAERNAFLREGLLSSAHVLISLRLLQLSFRCLRRWPVCLQSSGKMDGRNIHKEKRISVIYFPLSHSQTWEE